MNVCLRPPITVFSTKFIDIAIVSVLTESIFVLLQRMTFRILKAAQKAFSHMPLLYRGLRAVYRPSERFYRHLYFEGVFNLEIKPGVRILLESCGGEAENDLFWSGYGNSWEGRSLQIWRALAEDAQFIADVGANTGIFALAAQAVNPAAKIIAIEPSRRVFGALKRNVLRNGFPIQSIEVAASDAVGTATFYDTCETHQYSASLVRGTLGPGFSEVQVRVDRLDNIFKEHGFARLDLVKIDIELHEPAALRGMMQTVISCKPTILVEILRDDIGQEIKELLAGFGYMFVPVREDIGTNNEGKDVRSRNVLICKPEVFRRLRSEFGELEVTSEL